MTEQFRRTLRGWTESSEGWAVRLLGRSNLQYRDSMGTLAIHAEAMSQPWTTIVVETHSIPDADDRPRTEVVSRLRRAFAENGWTLVESPDEG